VIAYVVTWALFAFQRMILWKSRSCRPGSSGFAPRCRCPFLAAAIAMAIGKP
jgi:hypothetical protein